MGCASWWVHGFVFAAVLHFAILPLSSGSAASRKCDTIYKGFAECLISLGDSMAQSVQQHKEDTIEEVEELDSICKSWDEFHKCASNVLVNCPEEAAAIWESLRQESRKIQYQGNLHDLCSSRKNSMRGYDTGETNKETLRGSAYLAQFSLSSGIFAWLLQWMILQQA
ncbi:neuritin-like protein [Bombina bombina]|uniref:neuritin-like protein n=1 Tax=Bombina bombina TaxID=8345 RepID=UPI00235AEA7A|nr:neuritin-like protein [Bombina bombina]